MLEYRRWNVEVRRAWGFEVAFKRFVIASSIETTSNAVTTSSKCDCNPYAYLNAVGAVVIRPYKRPWYRRNPSEKEHTRVSCATNPVIISQRQHIQCNAISAIGRAESLTFRFSKAIDRTALSMQSKHHVLDSHRLSSAPGCHGDDVVNQLLHESFHSHPRLLIDRTRDALHAASTSLSRSS